MGSLQARENLCEIHGCHSRRKCRRKKSGKRYDVLWGGPPCQPYSEFRQFRFTTEPPEQHEFFPTMWADFDSILALVREFLPLVVVVEQVEGWNMSGSGETERSWCQRFQEALLSIRTGAAAGEVVYAEDCTRVLRLCPDPWLQLTRPRRLCLPARALHCEASASSTMPASSLSRSTTPWVRRPCGGLSTS